MRCPCKGCEPPKRTLSCHGCCAEYKEWRTWLDGVNKVKNEEQKKDLPPQIKKMWWKKLKRNI